MIEVRNSAKIVLLNDENKLLLIGIDDKNIKGQKGEYNGRFWQLIGGKIEDQESIDDALKRELFEETGLTEKDVEFYNLARRVESNNVWGANKSKAKIRTYSFKKGSGFKFKSLNARGKKHRY